MAEKSPKDTIDELKLMVTDYAKQQTVDPLKRLGEWVKFGVAGAIFLALGGFLLGLGVLRLLQDRSWTDGNWSWVPYGLVFVLLMACVGACGAAMSRRPEWMKEEGS